MTAPNVLVNTSDKELIHRAQGGEAAAFEELVHRYDQRVLSIAASYTHDPDDSKDIYQEVFLRVYRSLASFQFRSEFPTWIFRITTNVCLTHQMRRKNRTFISLDAEDEEQLIYTPIAGAQPQPASPEQRAQNTEIAAHIQEAVENLSPQQRLVFTLKHYEGYKLREIAVMMECGEGTVKKYLFTATEKMRKRLRKIY